MANQKYNWEQIRSEWIHGQFFTDPDSGIKTQKYPTFQDLHEKYGVSVYMLQQKSYRESWGKQRQIFKSKIERHSRDKRMTLMLDEGAKFDARVLDLVEKLGRVLRREIDRLAPDEDDITHPEMLDETEPINPQSLLTLTKTLDMLQAIGRKAVGEPINGISDIDLEEIKKETNPVNRKDRRQRIEQLTKRREELKKKEQSIREKVTQE